MRECKLLSATLLQHENNKPCEGQRPPIWLILRKREFLRWHLKGFSDVRASFRWLIAKIKKEEDCAGKITAFWEAYT
jgi:hypothetical protein